MNDFNPILDALNDTDTQYIIEPKRKKRLIALMIAAAAAAMALRPRSGAAAWEASPWKVTSNLVLARNP